MQDTLTAPLRFIVVAEQNQQRVAFSDTIHQWGYELIDCTTTANLKTWHFHERADIWLIDTEQDYDIVHQIEENIQITLPKVLVGFVNAPLVSDSYRYGKWQRQLKRKIAQVLKRPELLNDQHEISQPIVPWKYVVVLGASMGGPMAVKEFLDELPCDLPITLLLAQHFDPNMLNTLPRILNRHNQWRCEVITNSQHLLTGRCFIAPIDHSIVCDSNGRVILQTKAWNGIYQPSISQILYNCSHVFGQYLISIIFSGMGDDGSDVANIIKQNGGSIWVQTPETSICPSQPQSMIDTGKADYIADPKQLAQALVNFCRYHKRPTNVHELEHI